MKTKRTKGCWLHISHECVHLQRDLIQGPTWTLLLLKRTIWNGQYSSTLAHTCGHFTQFNLTEDSVVRHKEGTKDSEFKKGQFTTTGNRAGLGEEVVCELEFRDSWNLNRRRFGERRTFQTEDPRTESSLVRLKGNSKGDTGNSPEREADTGPRRPSDLLQQVLESSSFPTKAKIPVWHLAGAQLGMNKWMNHKLSVKSTEQQEVDINTAPGACSVRH